MISNDLKGQATRRTLDALSPNTRDLYVRTRRQLDELVVCLVRVERNLEDLALGEDVAPDLALAIAEAESYMHALTTDDGAHETANARNVDRSLEELTPVKIAGYNAPANRTAPVERVDTAAERVDEIAGVLKRLPWLAVEVHKFVEDEASYGNAPSARDIYDKFSSFKKKEVWRSINELIAAGLIHSVSDGYELKVQD